MTDRSFLVLRFDAPLMSFGGVLVDQIGVTDTAPTLSMLTGLLGNALGYHHDETAGLERLQERIRFGCRLDRPGKRLIDFQTVDLGQDFLRQGWTTHGRVAERAGGSAKTGTHIRRRHYWADAVYTVMFDLQPASEDPGLDHIEEALQRPERPLFLGRKPCLPASRLVQGRIGAPSLRAALARVPLADRANAENGGFQVWWPQESGEPEPMAGAGRSRVANDRRDWSNQVHTGRRILWHGQLDAQEVARDGA